MPFPQRFSATSNPLEWQNTPYAFGSPFVKLMFGEPIMSDGREEREEREKRREQEERENPEDRINRELRDQWKPERTDS